MRATGTAVAPEETMPGFDPDIFWKLAAWTIATYAGAISAALALGLEPSLMG
jgi:hypothetical protein